MSKARKARRLFPVILFMSAWLIVGLAIPLIISPKGDPSEIDTVSVVAATRHTARVYERIPIGDALGLSLESGQLGLAVQRDVKRTSAQRDELIASGGAELVLDGGRLVMFEAAKTAAPDYELIAPLATAVSRRAFVSLHLRESTLRILLPGGNHIDIDDVDALLRPLPPRDAITMAGTGTWQGQPATFRIDQRPAPVTKGGAASNETVTGLKVAFETTNLKIDFDGAVLLGRSAQFLGRTRISTPNFALLLHGWDNSSNDETRRTASLDGTIDWKSDALALDEAVLKLSDNTARGALNVTFAASRPLVSGTLDFDKLDLAEYVLGSHSKHTPALTFEAWWAHAWSMMRTPKARAVDLDLRVSADTLTLERISLGRAAASLLLSKGVLKANLPEFAFADGVGSGQIVVNFMAPSTNATIRGKISNLDARLASEMVSSPIGVSGRADLSLDTTVSGRTRAEHLKSLSGSMKLVARPQAANINVDLARSVKIEAPGPIGGLAGSTTLDALDLEFTFFNGKAYCLEGRMAGRAVTTTATGWIDLASSEVNLTMTTDAKGANPHKWQMSGLPGSVLIRPHRSEDDLRPAGETPAAQPASQDKPTVESGN